METLYKLQYHSIFFNKEKVCIDYIKDDNVDKIVFDTKNHNSFEIEFDWKIYKNRDFIVEKCQFASDGSALNIFYISKDRKLQFKEQFYYKDNNLLKRKFTLRARFKGVLSSIMVIDPELKKWKDGEMEFLAPFSPIFCFNGIDEIYLDEYDNSGRGVIIINSYDKNETFLCWTNSILKSKSWYKNGEMIHQFFDKKEIIDRDEYEIGEINYSFYSGNYIENIEDYAKEINEIILKKRDKYVSVFDKIVKAVINERMSIKSFLKWLELSKMFINYREESNNIENDSGIIKNMLSLITGENCEVEDEILKNGRVIFSGTKNDNENGVISFIKKSRGSFYLIVLNFSYFLKESEIFIEKEFGKENLKFEKYFVKNIVDEKIETIFRSGKGIKLNIEPLNYKILKFENCFESEEVGIEYKINNSEDFIAVKNSFYEAVFDNFGIRKLTGINSNISMIYGTSIDFEKEKFEIKKSKKRVTIKSENSKILFEFSEKNIINVKIEMNKCQGNMVYKFNKFVNVAVECMWIQNVFEGENFSKIICIGDDSIIINMKNASGLREFSITKESLKMKIGSKTKKEVVQFQIMVI